MRKAFAETLLDLAAEDERVVLLTGDLGFTVLEPFAERFPNRFFNAGVAEQNMLGMAAGLAEAGFVPFVYSIATFVTLRPYEFFRNGAAVHNLPVRVVGVGSGVDYGHNGISHYALEDMAVMRTQPNVTVVAPADAEQARAALAATWDSPGPIYYRIGKGAAQVPGLNGRFECGRLVELSDGSDIAVLAVGGICRSAMEAADRLSQQGLSVASAVVSSFNPSPVDDLAELLSRAPVAVTVESHYRDGGLGSLVAEVIAERGLNCRLTRCAIDSMPVGISGSPDYLLKRFGLDADGIERAALDAVSVRAQS